MERREFLKLFGFGTAILGAVALTMSPAAAASALAHGSASQPLTADNILKRMAETNGADGEFTQYYRRRRRRRRVCRRVRTRWGWRTNCYWTW